MEIAGIAHVRIEADATGLRDGLERARRDTENFERDSEQAYDDAGRAAGDYARDVEGAASRASSAHGQASQSASTIGTAYEAVRQQVIRLAATVGTYLGVRQVIRYGDAWTEAGNRIRSAGIEDVVGTQERLAQLAVDTRSEFGATVDLFAKLAIASQDMGITTEEVMGLVRAVNQSLILGGATASEAAGATRQLGQAIASGVLRGDEFNSISEQAPALAQAVADAMGIARTELRAAAEDGAITADILIRALQEYAPAAEEIFGETNSTISQAMTVLGTRLTEVVGNADEATGAFAFVADAIILLANNLDKAVIAVGAFATAWTLLKIGSMISGVSGLVGGIKGLGAALAFLTTNPWGLAITAIATIVGGIILWRNRSREVEISVQEHNRLMGDLTQAYRDARGEVDNWAEGIENATASQLLLNIQSRQQELEAFRFRGTAGGEAEFLTGGVPNAAGRAMMTAMGNTQDFGEALRAVNDQVNALKANLTSGLIDLPTFNSTIELMRESGAVTLESAAALQRNAAEWAALDKRVRESEALLRLLRDEATDADMELLGLAEATVAVGESARNIQDHTAGLTEEMAEVGTEALAAAEGLGFTDDQAIAIAENLDHTAEEAEASALALAAVAEQAINATEGLRTAAEQASNAETAFDQLGQIIVTGSGDIRTYTDDLSVWLAVMNDAITALEEFTTAATDAQTASTNFHNSLSPGAVLDQARAVNELTLTMAEAARATVVLASAISSLGGVNVNVSAGGGVVEAAATAQTVPRVVQAELADVLQQDPGVAASTIATTEALESLETQLGATTQAATVQTIAVETTGAAFADLTAILDQVSFEDRAAAIDAAAAAMNSYAAANDNAAGAADRLTTAEERQAAAMKEVTQVAQQFANTFVQGLLSGESAAEAFGKALQNLANQLIEMALNALIQMLISWLFGIPIGIGGRATGAPLNLLAGIGHSGGTVGSLGTHRSVDAALFVGAPRLHSGLAADEFPTILQRGETIIPKGSSGANPVNIKIETNIDVKGNADEKTLRRVLEQRDKRLQQELPALIKRADMNRRFG